MRKVHNQVTNTFKRALACKGYLSLCSIIESQYFIPRSYSMKLIKREHLAEVSKAKSKGLLPHQFNIAEYRNKSLKKKKIETPRNELR